MLLAVDLGLRTGLALYDRSGRLVRYRSANLGTRARLKRAVPSILAEAAIEVVVVEGDRALGDIWERAASRRGAPLLRVAPETWRATTLLSREQRTGRAAKIHAGRLARRVIEACDAPAPASLRHDAAEAILLGLWAVGELGWAPPRWTDEILREPLRR
jgi:hypothetical protein